MNEVARVDSVIGLLHTCKKKKDLAYAKRVYARIRDSGLEAHATVGNHIVPVFVECGSIYDAQQAFDRLTSRNGHCWTSLILGYVQSGQPQHALSLYKTMLEDSVHPRTHTFIALLKACACLADVKQGHIIHSEAVQYGSERDAFVSCSLIDMYCKCSSLLEAHDVLSKLSDQDVVSWNALILGHAELGNGMEVLRCIEEMQSDGISPNEVTFISSVKACSFIEAIEYGQNLHIKATQKGWETHMHIGSSLIDMYAKSGWLLDAHKVLHELPVRDIVSWNALLSGYAKHGCSNEVQICYQQMQLEDVSPDVTTFIGLLKASSDLKALDIGRTLHTDITQHGFGMDTLVCSTLVDLYVKSGCLLEAQGVFHKLSERDVVSWNVYITGCTELGFDKESLECYEQMQCEGVVPNAATFVAFLKACGSIKDLGKGQSLHMEILQRGLESVPALSNSLMDMYVKCSSLSEAQKVFYKLSASNTVLWNTLLAGYCEVRHDQEVCDYFDLMESEGFYTDAITFTCVLKACGNLFSLRKGRDLHRKLIERGFEKDQGVGTMLVGMYAKCGSLLEAWDILGSLPCIDRISWNLVIGAYAECESGEEALKCLELMQSQGLIPSISTILYVLKACNTTGAIRKGQELHAIAVKFGCDMDLFIGSALVDMYVKCGSIVDARAHFNHLPAQNAVSWNAIIAGYAEHGPAQEVLNLSEQMRLQGVSQDVITYVSIAKAYGSIGSVKKGQEIHTEIINKGFEKDYFLGSTLVDMYAKCGSLAEARVILESMPTQNVVPWNVLIAGYIEHGADQKAFELFDQMHLQNIFSNSVTYACMLKSCGKLGLTDKGNEMHVEVVLKGLETDALVSNTVLDMYIKCGLLLEAHCVFDKLPVQNVVTWNTIIQGYSNNNESDTALHLFEKMCNQGVKADATTFTCLLSACSRGNLFLRGQNVYKIMIEKHGILPSLDHFTCMVDILARSGHLNEAEKLLGSMPCSPCKDTWTALLSACKRHEEAVVGLRCFQELTQKNLNFTDSDIVMVEKFMQLEEYGVKYTGKFDR